MPAPSLSATWRPSSWVCASPTSTSHSSTPGRVMLVLMPRRGIWRPLLWCTHGTLETAGRMSHQLVRWSGESITCTGQHSYRNPEPTIIFYYRFIANKVRPINAELDSQVKNVFESADINCEAELTEQDRILLEDIANVRSKRIIPKEYYDYVNDSDAFSQVD